MATGGLYGNSGTGALIAQPGTETPGLYGKSPNGSVVAQPGSESAGLYGNGTTFGGYYFEWFVFQTSATQPATPTGGTWNFQTDSGTAPSGWTNAPASNPTNPVWISIALVNSRSTSPLVWSTPGVLSYSGTINGSGAPTSGIGQIGELYIQTGVTPNALWFKSGSTTWTQITGSALYVDLTSSQTIAGTKTFSSTIQGNISGNAGTVTNGVYTDGSYVNPSWIASLAGSKITGNISGNAANVTGTVAIVNGGTGATTASGARTNLGLGTIATQDASSVAITGGSITGITDLAIADGGTGASTAGQARTNLGLGTAAVLDAGVANGVATLDAGGTVPLSQIPASIQGGVSYQGAWNASTNTPTLTSSVGTKGYYYVVSVAGSTNLNGVTSWNIGDWAIFNGTAWEKIDNTDAVTSVNGFTGTVVLTAANVNALAIANNLSDLANAGTARTNLGLGTAATQNSTAFATAAQGATADTALQTVTSADGSIVVLQTGTNIDLAVSAASPASTLLAQVRNTTGATLTKGTVVYISGATGQISTVSKANASSDATSAQTLGMITANLANNSNGYVTVFGLLQNMDTSAYTDGAQLYLSGTVAGAVTATKPSAPIHLVYVAVVEYAHPTQGKLLVKVQNGYELAEIHDVSIVSPTTGQTLVYDSVTDLWSNSNAPTITGGTINNTTIGATTPSTGVFTTLTAQNETLKGTGQNLILQSQTYTNSSWNSSTATRADNQTTAPDSTNTAGTITSVNTVYGGYLRQTPTLTATTYTLSVYIKKNNWTYVGFRVGSVGSTDLYPFVNLDTGATNNQGLSGVTLTATSVGSGWYRCVLVAPNTATGASPFDVAIVAATGNVGTNNGAGQIAYVWGAQLEIGSTANTYIPTTTTAVYGTPTLSFSGVASIGLQSDGSLYETSAGTGNVRFYTNNIGQEQARVSHTASAVNYHQLTGSATGSGPIYSVAGSDTNIDLNLTSKGTGGARFNVGNGSKYTYLSSDSANNFQLIGAVNTANLGIYATGGGSLRFYTAAGLLEEQLRIPQTASAVNFVQIAGAATSGAPVISALGSDTNVRLVLTSKGGSAVDIFTGNAANIQARFAATGNGTNYVQLGGANTTFGPIVSSAGSDTNIPLVLQPKGTGALQAQQTDSTATGGNARGVNAIDLQTGRDLAAQVASGAYSVISGGYGNRATSTYSATLSGGANINSSFQGVIAGGTNNQISSLWSGIFSGNSNVANGYYNFIGGGWTNSATSSSAVTTQSGTMNATTAVTLSSSNASIKVGQYVSGTSIANNTYVAAISGTSLTLSQAASGSSTSTLSFYTPHGVVVGGGNNQATGSYSFIGGGGDAGTASNRNVASGDWSVVGGGIKNVASGHGSVIAGGGTYLTGAIAGNIASGAGSTIGGGSSHTASGFLSVISGGFANVASQNGSTVVGGWGNTSNSQFSTVSGSSGTTRGVTGYTTFAACDVPVASTAGSSQAALLVLGNETLNASPVVLRSNTAAASTTNQVILPNNSAYYFKGSVIANVTGAANGAAWSIEGAIMRGANAASTVLMGTPAINRVAATAGATAWAIAITADTTNGGLAVTVTGAASTTIRWVCKAETTETTF